MPESYWVETLGCPKNQVDSDKLGGRLSAGGLVEADDVSDADVVVVNTCAFIEEARQESIDAILAIDDARGDGSRLVVTGCMAERYGAELAEHLPEVDEVAAFGVAFSGLALGDPTDAIRVPVAASGPRIGEIDPLRRSGSGNGTAVDVKLAARRSAPDFDLLALPRPPAAAPWAYVKIAEGCDRACGFCAIPSFRGPQRSRGIDDVLSEIDQLAAKEIVLVAQDLASYGRDQGSGERRLIELVAAASKRVARVRLLYLYPSELTDALVDAICGTGVPYFDLSLQHVSGPLLRRMRRWGDGGRFMERIDTIRTREPHAALRSNFIVGYPGETEHDHDLLLDFVAAASLDWCGFFAYSAEDGTYAADLQGVVDRSLVEERLSELRGLQDTITARRRDDLIGESIEVLVDERGVGRTHREAPEIDGIVSVPVDLEVGTFQQLVVTGAAGPDLEAQRP